MARTTELFKHADRDPPGVSRLRGRLAEQVLFRACRNYTHFETITIPMRILEIYYCLRHPDVLLNPTTRQAFATPPAWMLNESRSHFYDVMLDAAEDMRVVSDDGSQTAA